MVACVAESSKAKNPSTNTTNPRPSSKSHAQAYESSSTSLEHLSHVNKPRASFSQYPHESKNHDEAQPNLKRFVQPKNLTQLLLPLWRIAHTTPKTFQTLLGMPQKALTTLLPILQPFQISKHPQPSRKVMLLKISLFLLPPSLSHLSKLLLLPF